MRALPAPNTRLSSEQAHQVPRADDALTTLDVSRLDVSSWEGPTEWPVRLANFSARYAPRGKAWFPRLLGRMFQSRIRSCVRTQHGARMAIEPTSLDMFAFLAVNHGTWSENVFNTCAGFLRKGDVFYDIGANVGYMSIDMAQVFRGQIEVISIEPQQKLCRNIALSARLNGFQSVKVFELMLGECEGQRDLFLASHSIHASAIGRENRSKKVPCKLTTLDFLIENGLTPPPNVIKLDVEGGELDVFRGARSTLRNHRPVIVFECDENVQRFGYTKQDVLEYISGIAEYEFFDIGSDGTLLPVTTAPADVLARPKTTY